MGNGILDKVRAAICIWFLQFSHIPVYGFHIWEVSSGHNQYQPDRTIQAKQKGAHITGMVSVSPFVL